MPTLPQNLEAEKALLAACLLKPSELDATADVQPDDFLHRKHIEAWKAMQALRARGDAVEMVTVASEVGGDAVDTVAWLATLLDHAPVTGAQTVARLVVEASRKRRLITLCGETRTRAFGADPADDVIAELRGGIAGIEISGSGDGPAVIGDGLAGALTVIEGRARNPNATGIATGHRLFDAKIGRFQEGNLIIGAGLAGMGKSSWALGIAEHAATTGHPVLMFILEMSAQEQTERLLAAGSMVDGHKIRTGALEYREWQDIQRAASKISKLPLYMDSRTLTISQIQGETRRWYAKHANNAHALVVVDYLQLVRTEGKNQNRERDVADISLGMKHLAKTTGMKITVLALSQMNRSVAKEMREPRISDLRESGQIEQDADMIVFPWREMITSGDDGPRVVNESGPCKLIVGKHRGGPTGAVPAYWNAPVMRFGEVTYNPPGDTSDNWVDN